MIWCVTWSISEHDSLPGGNLFGLLIIFYSAIIGGKLVELIRIPSVPQFPSLLGKGRISSHFALLTVCKLLTYFSWNSYNLEIFQCNMVYV